MDLKLTSINIKPPREEDDEPLFKLVSSSVTKPATKATALSFTSASGPQPGLVTDVTSITAATATTEPEQGPKFSGTSVEEAIQVLKSEPDYENLVAVLQFLDSPKSSGISFNIAEPSPHAAQIVRLLIAEIVPNYWVLLNEGSIVGDVASGSKGNGKTRKQSKRNWD